MPKKKKQSSSHGYISFTMMSVIASSVVVTAAMTNAEGEGTRAVVSYSGASANTYQPVLPYQPVSETSVRTSSPPKPVLSRALFNRKAKQLNRKITSVHKRLMAAEDKIEVLERMISTTSGDTSVLQESLVKLMTSRDQLETQLAKLNAAMAELKLQL